MIYTEPACAKLNLSLDILGKRADGYHDLRMVMASIDLADEVTVSFVSEPGIQVSADLPYLPRGGGNIAAKAAERFFQETGLPPAGLSIHIRKRVPVCAGMAGGSSDGAAVLRVLRRALAREMTVERLEELGYRQYEISNFAKPGYESRHNLKYWTLGEYAGFGPGAHSDLGDVRYSYCRDLAAYCRGVETGENIIDYSEYLTDRDRDIEYIMLGLRTVRGVARREFEYRCRLPFAPVEEVLARFAASGHARREGERWRLTPEGFLLSNQIIGQCLEALAQVKLQREEAAASHDYRVRQP